MSYQVRWFVAEIAIEDLFAPEPEESINDLQPQLGRTEALDDELEKQVKLLRRDYKEIAEVLRGV